jgi:cytochrome c5
MRTSQILLIVLAVVSLGMLAACAQKAVAELPPVTDADPAIFADNAFPPVLPADADHRAGADSWMQESCLNCHEDGRNGAPVVVHEGMADILLAGKCRSCHTTSAGNG